MKLLTFALPDKAVIATLWYDHMAVCESGPETEWIQGGHASVPAAGTGPEWSVWPE